MAKRRSGEIKEDPAKSAEIGSKFQLEAMQYPPLISKGHGAIQEWDNFKSSLLAISFSDGKDFRLDGSAVLVAPGLALAARHVFDPLMEEIMAGRLVPIAISIMPDGLLIWRIHQLVMGDTDVVILRLDLASDFPPHGFTLATLTTRTPLQGEPVMIAGARSTDSVQPGEPLSLRVYVSVGEVGDIYATGRDKVMLPHPSVGVNCLTLGGMSGGPAFDQNGNLLGILTSSIEDDEGPSFVSLWWPVAGYEIQSLWLPGLVSLPTNLLALAKSGTVFIDEASALTVATEGARIQTQYRAWS